ncbi:MAG: hypothetical protein KA275_00275 [Chitinophagaceae bacterium]|nr:hypothetical protein [Chitinophagaceae bacterium]
MSEEKKCLNCNKNLIGRSDKKFCNDYCRNEFNNKNKIAEPLIIKTINKKLKDNRLLLEKILDTENTKSYPKEKLLQAGFDFNYFTHQLQTTKGLYIFNYDYGFLNSDNDWVLIVKRKE